MAAGGARCDFGHYVGAGPDNAEAIATLAGRAVGLKMYLGQTFGDLRLDDISTWATHLEAWPEDGVIAVHAEGSTLKTIIELADSIGRSIHICHVAGADDIGHIAVAKERGVDITCEAAPHHLFLDRTTDLPPGRAEVRPRLGTPEDRRALWEHLDVIDCFATDHAPHTLEEKDGDDPPPGFPGVETMLPLLLTATHRGLLDLDDIVSRLHHRPVDMFGLPVDEDSWVEVDVDASYEIPTSGQSRSGWTPFAGMSVRGRVDRVAIRGEVAYEHGGVVAAAGTGRDVRREGSRRP